MMMMMIRAILTSGQRAKVDRGLDSQFKGMYNTCIIMYVYNYIILYLSNNLSFFFDSVEKRVEPWII